MAACAFATLMVENWFPNESAHASGFDRMSRGSVAAPQNLANLAWSFSTLPFRHPPLLEAISAPAQSRRGEFDTRHLANILWAGAKLAVNATPLL
mmetsp:Transcript_41887/g.135563  ORF Transcript_41887/g.135563 Transcript_41887/m.135563 type:complete len:95 (+) Transcript_41887:476-760(+)